MKRPGVRSPERILTKCARLACRIGRGRPLLKRWILGYSPGVQLAYPLLAGALSRH
jgi:hypothetical protein